MAILRFTAGASVRVGQVSSGSGSSPDRLCFSVAAVSAPITMSAIALLFGFFVLGSTDGTVPRAFILMTFFHPCHAM